MKLIYIKHWPPPHWALMRIIPFNPHNNYVKLVSLSLFYTGRNWDMIPSVKPLYLTPDPDLLNTILFKNSLCTNNCVNVEKGKWMRRAGQLGKSFRGGKKHRVSWDKIVIM